MSKKTMEPVAGEQIFREADYLSLLDVAAEGVFRCTPQGRLLYANAALARMFGYESPEEMLCSINRIDEELFANRTEYELFQEQIFANQEVNDFKIQMRSGDDFEKIVNLNARAIYNAEEQLEYIDVALEDITQCDYDRELFKDKQAAEKANKAKSDFLANMSHEIRTPMNSILGFCDLLMDDITDENQLQHVNVIRNAGKSLLLIINDILDLSKIESGKFNVEICEHSLSVLLETVESLMLPKATEKNITFKLRRSIRIPEKIHTDPLRLQQCLINLIGNSIKFTDEGHVFLTVFYNEKKAELIFEVEDTGVGIPEDELETVFAPFSQVNNKDSEYTGTGLGLTITRELVHLLGGSITAESVLGEGSKFKVTLPVDSTDSKTMGFNQEILDQISGDAKSGTLQTFKGKALIVEDNMANQKLFKTALTQMGLEVKVAKNGLEALEAVEIDYYDLIFMDMQMPVLNGYDATRKMRKESIVVPIIATTAHVSPEEREECLSVGCSDFLAKPVKKRDLIRVLKKYQKA